MSTQYIMSRCRCWCFTLNNYTPEELTNLEENDKYRYIVYGREIAPTTGTPHLQGYVAFDDAKTLSSVKKNLRCKRLSLRIAKASAEQNKNYCAKGECEDYKTLGIDSPTYGLNAVVYESGDMPTQGARVDLNDLANAILSGETTEDAITEENPMAYHQYGRTINKLMDLSLRKKYRTWTTTCDWIYGESGTGKSHRAFEGFNPDTHYLMPRDGGWWDGYTGQSTVIMNEFRKGSMEYAQLLELVDKWPATVKRRGREPVPFLARHIIITSVLHPSECYCNLALNDSLDQLYRRITLKHLTEKYNVEV